MDKRRDERLMTSLDNAKKSLDSTLSTISNCDNKANALLTAVGIVFGFSMFSIQELSGKNGPIKVLVITFGILYLLSFLTTIVLLVLIVFPRRKTKKEINRQLDYQCYTEDLFIHLKEGDLDSFVAKNVNAESVIDQIKNCTRIAHTKENLLRIATISLIVFAIFLVCLVVCIFI